MVIIRFRRNRGKSAALAAGFEKARGQYVITMDADLQDDPSEMPRLLAKIEEGYDLVSGWKKKRQDPLSKKLPSRIFNKMTSLLTGVKLHDMNCGLKAYRQSVVAELDIYGELHRFIPVLAKEKGFRLGEIEVQHHPRRHGKTKFGGWRFISGFLDLFTIIITTRFLARPLHFFGSAGLGGFPRRNVRDCGVVCLEIPVWQRDHDQQPGGDVTLSWGYSWLWSD